MADRRPYRDDDSYRPSRHVDNFRRSPPRASARAPRGRSRSRSAERFRARSRSPRGAGFRDRARSPRREFSPRRGDDGYRRERERSRDSRYGRSPPRRDHSPPPFKRARDYSPDNARDRSPPAKRERFADPPRRTYDERPRAYSPQPRRAYSPPRERAGYRPRSRSPRREERVEPYEADNWRRTSPGGRRSPYETRDSAPTSRLSSPPHADRMHTIVDERPTRPPPDASPPTSYRPRSRSPPRQYEAPTQDREREYANGGPPSGPAPRDFSYGRAPPSGPSSRNFTAPAAPPSAAPMSAHSRTPYTSNPVMGAPSHPRGGGMMRGGYGRGDRGGFPSSRRSSMHGGPPTGPRAPMSYPAVPFRGSSNSTSLTYPRTQRFNQPATTNNHPHLADLPQVVPGGKKLPSGVDNARILELEEKAQKMRQLIAEKEVKSRKSLREFEKLSRDADNAGLRTELADGSLRTLDGETAEAAF